MARQLQDGARHASWSSGTHRACVEAARARHWAYDFIYLWHIPAFVFVSGYLSKSFEWDHRHMKSLLYTLLVPYLIFEPALYYYRVGVVGEAVHGTLWLEPHWTMWYLVVLLMWRLVTPILKLHWLFLPLSVIVSLVGGVWDTEALMIPRFLGLLPFFVLGLHLKPRHLAHLDDVWVRIAAVPDARRHRGHGALHRHLGRDGAALVRHRATRTSRSTTRSSSRPGSP